MINGLPRLFAPISDALISEPPPSAMELWNQRIVAAKSDDRTIDIFGRIGPSFFSEGTTTKDVSDRLKDIGKKPVTVNVNSPGGSFFEGVGIFNVLKEHPADVTVNVLGMAASAAAIIAMAGNKIKIGDAASIMIHNTSIGLIGDRHFMRNRASILETFDKSLHNVFSKRTKNKVGDIEKMMDQETWLSGNEAIEKGFADELLDSDKSDEKVDNEIESQATWEKFDAALAKIQVSRKTRRQLMSDIKNIEKERNTPKPGAGDDETLRAFNDRLIKATKRVKKIA